MSLTPEEAAEALKLGRLNYQAYLQFSDGKSLVSGAPLPPFERLDERIQRAWAFAANTVAIHQSGLMVERLQRDLTRYRC